MFTREELIKATGAKVLKDSCRVDETFSISTDTRTIKENDVYLPLKGKSFDGEKFIQDAIASGAKAYFTTGEDVFDGVDLVLQVENTLDAYLNIAAFYRQKINPITVGVTGSSGKTTTKELVYSVLSQKFKTHKTYSNHNNEVGFCQTVLSMPEDTQALIVEAGMRGLGEIELISTHLNPDFAILTNAGTAHVGRLGSLDNIAIAKCEMAIGLRKNGVFISKNQEIIKNHLKFNGEKIYYSLEDVEFLEKAPSYTKFLYKGEIYELNVDGEYNVENSLAAIELGHKLSMSHSEISQGLLAYSPIEKRWEAEEINGIKFINDSYNANPESMKASVKTFIELYKNPVVVLGDMGELGDDEVAYHTQVGEYFATLNKSVKYFVVGNLAQNIGNALKKQGFSVEFFNDVEGVSCYILENSFENCTIFLKASRSMQFEQILENVKRGTIKK
jgi:UDP-N-acetylmuramoyl-tripeptide--D-alanyl-D-alanine ligase